jgi:hypothetical protein
MRRSLWRVVLRDETRRRDQGRGLALAEHERSALETARSESASSVTYGFVPALACERTWEAVATWNKGPAVPGMDATMTSCL